MTSRFALPHQLVGLLVVICQSSIRAIGISSANVRSFVRSFGTKSAPRISRKLFELDSPNFIGTSTLSLSTALPDITSLPTSGRKLWWKTVEYTPPTASIGISRERFNRGSWNFTSLSRTSDPHKWHKQLIPVGCKMLLNITKKCGKRVRMQKRLISRKWCEIRQTISVLHRQNRLQIARVKNIGRVFELSGAHFA